LFFENQESPKGQHTEIISNDDNDYEDVLDIEVEEALPESLSLQNNEKDLIVKALEKHRGRRNKAADELGISQRTLYRKIKQYNLED
jgi:transcriptional regulator with PAS, ATPase and Fis domain